MHQEHLPHLVAKHGRLPLLSCVGLRALMQVARCTKIISPNTEDAKYVINIRQIAKAGAAAFSSFFLPFKISAPLSLKCTWSTSGK